MFSNFHQSNFNFDFIKCIFFAKFHYSNSIKFGVIFFFYSFINFAHSPFSKLFKKFIFLAWVLILKIYVLDDFAKFIIGWYFFSFKLFSCFLFNCLYYAKHVSWIFSNLIVSKTIVFKPLFPFIW